MRGFGSGVRSYLSWLAAFRNEQTSPNETTEIESSGLFYAGAAGFRFDFSPSFFLDIQATLFESALMATDTTKVTVGGATEETETKRTEIYVDSFGGVDDVSFGVGLEF
jgi:hypothetical protein